MTPARRPLRRAVVGALTHCAGFFQYLLPIRKMEFRKAPLQTHRNSNAILFATVAPQATNMLY
jgi:hypothetical protein